MQPSSREMHGMGSRNTQIPSLQDSQVPHFDHSTNDDFLDQMLSTLPAWPDLSSQNPKSPWESQNPNTTTNHNNNTTENKIFKARDMSSEDPSPESLHYYDESTLLASRLRQHQISGTSSLQQQLLRASAPSPANVFAGDSGFFPLPLTLGSGDSSVSPSGDVSGSVQGLFNGLTGSLPRPGQNQQHFHHLQAQNFNVPTTGMNQAQAVGAGAVAAPVRPKVRARRGQATDPHSIAERLRRERIAERMKALQELVPNANKTDKASMLDEIIDYVKFLQLQVKVLSMSRLGGAAAVAPLVADISAEGGGDCIQAGGRNSNGAETASSNDNNITITEHQVAKLMEEDMGSAMQYLQGKGLCLMPISLASAISTATCHSRNPPHNHNNPLDGPSSPSLSVLTVQSATMVNGGGGGEPTVKDATSVSKP